jgi:hypothetical protein
MARQEVDDLTSSLRRIRIRGEIVGDTQPGFVGRPVEVTIEPQISTVRILEGAQVEDNAGVVTIAPFARSALAEARIGRQPFGEPGTRVLSDRAIEYWARGEGFVEVQRLKNRRRGYISPRARNRGFVRFEDFVVEEDTLVVSNSQSRGTLAWVWNTQLRGLPRFSLTFTEYWVSGYAFHTVWHREEDGWLERATRVVELRTGHELDFEVAPTIYYPAVRGTGPLWGLYTP